MYTRDLADLADLADLDGHRCRFEMTFLVSCGKIAVPPRQQPQEPHDGSTIDRGSAMTMKTPETETLLRLLKNRFEKNMRRHAGMAWSDVRARLEGHPEALKSLQAMEATSGEPDVMGEADDSGSVIFCDCSPESPTGRRSSCFDGEARAARKENKPENSAGEMAAAMGIELLTEAQYRALQALGEFDLKTSSWLQTPPEVRALGGALFGDRRYGRVFVYHNGVQSYYAARGFRGVLRV